MADLSKQIRRLNKESESLAQDVVRDLEGLLERIEALEDALTERDHRIGELEHDLACARADADGAVA